MFTVSKEAKTRVQGHIYGETCFEQGESSVFVKDIQPVWLVFEWEM